MYDLPHGEVAYPVLKGCISIAHAWSSGSRSQSARCNGIVSLFSQETQEKALHSYFLYELG